MINKDSNKSKQYTIPKIWESIIEDDVKDILQRLIHILKQETINSKDDLKTIIWNFANPKNKLKMKDENLNDNQLGKYQKE